MSALITSPVSKYIYWPPRILGLIIVSLFAMLSFDVFGEYSGYQLIIALIMHSIPAVLLAIALLISWKNELYGGMIFNLLGILTIFFFNTTEDAIVFFIVTVPILMIGELFFLNWYKKSSQFK